MKKTKQRRPPPEFEPWLCKACGRCISACPQQAIRAGETVIPESGYAAVAFDLERCNGCGLCLDACPEPFALAQTLPVQGNGHDLRAAKIRTTPAPQTPYQLRVLPECEPIVLKGTHASAIGALLAGCRHFFGYPITPSTEGAELMAALLPRLGGIYYQAVSEIAAVNMMYGCGGAGKRSMTFTSSPGFSLMLEGISYIVGAEVPAVFVNVMRGGPGLGNIGPEQADIKLACRGLGHGNTHAIVLAPATPQEMLDMTMLAFSLAFRYRNPVIVLADGTLGQMTGKVSLPPAVVEPGIPEWAVSGDARHRTNLINSLCLLESDLEEHNIHLNAKYTDMAAREPRSESLYCNDADVIIVACNTPARIARGAVRELRSQGVRVGLFRPITLWPFPIDAFAAIIREKRALVVVEASPGQLEDELRLAMSHAGISPPQMMNAVRHFGGVLPQVKEIVDLVQSIAEVAHEQRVL